MSSNRFLISSLVDFPDDCSNIAFTPELLEDLIERLHWMGVRRVYWNYYQEGIWPWYIRHSPAGTRPTLENLGEPMALGRRLSHKHGMEFYAVIKPFETGLSLTTPPGSLSLLDDPGIAGIGGNYHVDDWVARHPELRVRARTADVPVGLESIPVTHIQLRQKDMSPIRIRPQNIQIWTSEDNTLYRKKDVAFSVSEDVDNCPRDVMEQNGNSVTCQGESVRVLNLTGMSLLDPFIVVTTDFDDDTGTFRNTAKEMVRAFGPGDEPLPIVVASQKGVWRPQRDLRTGDLQYDGGLGDVIVCLDVSNSAAEFPGWEGSGSNTRDGVVAFAKGRNQYLSGALCEAYPQVQDFWMGWVGECVAAGVDGMDVRISCHSSWTDWPDSFGFNEPVVGEYKRRHGINPDVEDFDRDLIGDVRGDFFDQFLRRAKHRLKAAGKSFQLHLEVESFRPDACQSRWRTRPGNLNFHWRRWLRSGLADEVTLFGRGWTPERILDDALAKEMIAEANASNVPVHLSKQVMLTAFHGDDAREGNQLADWLDLAYRSGDLAGYTFYETAGLYDCENIGSDGKLQFHPGVLESIRNRAESLGLLN